MKITVGDAAAIMGCSEQFIRIGLQRGAGRKEGGHP